MKRLLAPLVLVLLAACAQVRELQGGEKDTRAPRLLAAEPQSGTVRFSSERIVLRFDERIKLDRVRDRLLISPPLDKAPEVTVNGGDEVVIALRAPLAPNTTYTINIGEAITDITEGNPAAGLTYVLSTGEVLDSLWMSGTVIDAFTGEPEVEALVVLHTDTDSTGFARGRPAYFTRTDQFGGFHLKNLRAGEYRLHALQDQNANFRNDLPNERVAFMDSLVDPLDSAEHVLRIFLPLANVQQVKEAIVQPDRCWRLVFARPIDSVALASIDRTGGSLSWSQDWNVTSDTILFWPSDTTLLNGQQFTVSDSAGVIDTITYRPMRKMPFNLDVRSAGRSGNGVPMISTSRPVARIDSTRALLRVDSVDTPAAFLRYEGGRLFDVKNAPLGGSQATLVLLPGAFEDIYGGVNDTIRLSLGSSAAAQTGDLKVNLTQDSAATLTGPFFVQVLNAQGGVVRTEAFDALPHVAHFAGTPAGVFTLKLIADADGDGLWSTGSLTKGRQPEQVFRQNGEVNVRAGWEVVVDWAVEDH